jgi:hypothetical protein
MAKAKKSQTVTTDLPSRKGLKWTDEEDRLLVPVLQDARVVARATDTSFRTEVWQKASEALILGGFNRDTNACESRYRRVCTVTIC